MHAILSHPALADCRRLFLRDYEIYINIGVHDFEKKAEQRVILNVDLYIPLNMNTPSKDLLEEVVDYDFMRETIKACLLYTSPSPRDLSTSRMPSSA